MARTRQLSGLVAELPPKLRPFFNGRRELCAVNWGRLRSPRACPNRVCLQWHQPATVFPSNPSGRSKLKKYTGTTFLEVKIRLPGHAGANRDRHEWDPTSSLPAFDAQGTRPQVTSENGWYPSVVAPSQACCKARFAIEDRVLEDSAPICALAVLSY